MRRRLWPAAALTLLVLVACTTQPTAPSPTSEPTASLTPSPPPTRASTPTPTLSPSPEPTATRMESPVTTPPPLAIDEDWIDPPERPLPEAERLATRVPLVPNARRDFWVADAATGERRTVQARLRVQSAHAAVWVEDSVWHDIRQLEAAAETFDTEIYPTMRSAFGAEQIPGSHDRARIVILHTRGLGDHVPGYTSSLDAYPSEVHPWSNEADMITVNLDAVDVGSPGYRAVLARGLVDLVHRHHDRNEERWVREGLADLGAALIGSDMEGLHAAYVEQTNVSLTHWEGTAAERGAASLLATYFHQRFGDEGTRILTAEPANGLRGFEAALDELDVGLTFDELFGDWLASTYLEGDGSAADSVYQVPKLDLPPVEPTAIYDTYPVTTEASLQQLGAHYVVLRGDEDLEIQFTGQDQTPLWPHALSSPLAVWWSNRGDESQTRLTGEVDLREMELEDGQAALSYRAWYDIEAHYDYTAVELSADGGQNWHVLRTPSGTGANPYRNNPGWGYTGQSDGWIGEEIDLSGYAGQTVLLRFSYLTDGAVTGEGLLLDDISVALAEDEGGRKTQEIAWTTQGFVLTDGLAAQDYVALLILVGDEITVERLEVGEDRTGAWSVPLSSQDVREAVLVLSALTPVTRQPASYRLTITPSQR